MVFFSQFLTTSPKSSHVVPEIFCTIYLFCPILFCLIPPNERQIKIDFSKGKSRFLWTKKGGRIFPPSQLCFKMMMMQSSNGLKAKNHDFNQSQEFSRFFPRKSKISHWQEILNCFRFCCWPKKISHTPQEKHIRIS